MNLRFDREREPREREREKLDQDTSSCLPILFPLGPKRCPYGQQSPFSRLCRFRRGLKFLSATVQPPRACAGSRLSTFVLVAAAPRRSSRTILRAELSEDDFSRLMRRMTRLERIVEDQVRSCPKPLDKMFG